MGEYSQANRPMRIDTPLGEDLLLLEGFEAEEGLSRPYLYTLDLLSEDADIQAEDLLLKKVLISMDTHPEKPKFLTHGVVRAFVRLSMSEGLARYRAEVVPSFWFLTQVVDCRIFQEKSVIDIVEELLEEGASTGAIKFDNRCQLTYAPREYCVQYRESTFNFISRLLEEEGIFYFFEHADGDETLVLADSKATFDPCPEYEKLRCVAEGRTNEQVIHSIVETYAVRDFEVALQDYDPLQSSVAMYGNMKSTNTPVNPVFDYPGLFTTIDEGEVRARIDLERREKSSHQVTGTSGAHGLRSGKVIEVEEHFRSSTNTKYYLDRIRHSAHSGAYRAWDQAEFHYSNEFTAFPDTVPFRPDRNARVPVVRGTQTAVVVGKAGEEVWTDKHGRVKVQFHWDRYGKKDEKSSCWIRVAMKTAGKGWGHVEIPRMGHEVLVDFLEGNPDRPIIVGSVYNDVMTPPYPLPDKGVVSGIKTRSSKDSTGYNELIMDDKAGEELIRMHAEKDLQVDVVNDHTTTVKEGNQTNTVKEGDQTNKVEQGEQTIEVDKDRTITVQAGDLTTTVKMGDITFKAKKGKVTIDGMKEIVLKCGPSQMKLSPSSIELKSPVVKVNADGMAEFKAGGMAKVEGGGMVQLQGGIVKIN